MDLQSKKTVFGRKKTEPEIISIEDSHHSSARISTQRSDNYQTKSLEVCTTIDLTIDYADLTPSESTHTDSKSQISSKGNGGNLNKKRSIIDLTQSVSVAQDFKSWQGEKNNLPKRKKQKLKTCDSQESYFSCAICLDDEVEQWKRYSLSSCNHNFCLPCLGNHIQFSTTKNIKCPSCPSHIELFDIQSVLVAIDKKDEWEKYSNKASFSLLDEEIIMGKNGVEQKKDSFQHKQEIEITSCCPAERCNYIFVYKLRDPELQEGTRFDCPSCFNSFCLQCGANDDKVGPAHDGTCYDRRKKLLEEEEERIKFEQWKRDNSQADAKFNELLAKEGQIGKTKACPKCAFPITKNGGCDHMCCSQCGHDFNWSSAKKIK